MHAPVGSNQELQVADNPGSHIVMEGREVFKYAVKAMAEACRSLLDEQNLTADDLHLVIPHQANIRIINKLTERLGVVRDKVFINVSDYGNTSAASIPIALDEAHRSGRIRSGDKILFCSFGGGLTWGASLITW